VIWLSVLSGGVAVAMEIIKVEVVNGYFTVSGLPRILLSRGLYRDVYLGKVVCPNCGNEGYLRFKDCCTFQVMHRLFTKNRHTHYSYCQLKPLRSLLHEFYKRWC